MKLKYHPWIEEVFIGMEEKTNMPSGYTACPELLPMSPTDDHPIPILCGANSHKHAFINALCKCWDIAA